MRISRGLIEVALVGLTVGLGAPRAMGDLAVDSWTLAVDAVDAALPLSAQIADIGVSSPFGAVRTATAGGASNTTAYDFGWDAAGGSFNWNFDHQRSGAPLGAQGSIGGFTTGSSLLSITYADMPYDFSGAYDLTGNPRVFGLVHLFDVSDGTVLFDWFQMSTSSPNESFVVGQGGGDNSDNVHGSQFGTLLAGHQYVMAYQFGILSTGPGDAAATALGDFHFNILSAAPVVPAPGAAMLAMIGLPFLAMFKRRHA